MVFNQIGRLAKDQQLLVYKFQLVSQHKSFKALGLPPAMDKKAIEALKDVGIAANRPIKTEETKEKVETSTYVSNKRGRFGQPVPFYPQQYTQAWAPAYSAFPSQTTQAPFTPYGGHAWTPYNSAGRGSGASGFQYGYGRGRGRVPSSGLCYLCSQPGHMARECPMGQQPQTKDGAA